MERPQIIFRNKKFYIFFSTNVRHVNPKWIDRVGEEKITDSSLYCYVAERITGPYHPLSGKPIVKGSEKTGLYATNFIEGPEGKLIAYGTYPSSFTLEVSPRFSVIWEDDTIEIVA
jgi:Levansucrase/Invertase